MRQICMPPEKRKCPYKNCAGEVVYVAESPKADTYACTTCGRAVWWHRGVGFYGVMKATRIWGLRFPAFIRKHKTPEERDVGALDGDHSPYYMKDDWKNARVLRSSAAITTV